MMPSTQKKKQWLIQCVLQTNTKPLHAHSSCQVAACSERAPQNNPGITAAPLSLSFILTPSHIKHCYFKVKLCYYLNFCAWFVSISLIWILFVISKRNFLILIANTEISPNEVWKYPVQIVERYCVHKNGNLKSLHLRPWLSPGLTYKIPDHKCLKVILSYFPFHTNDYRSWVEKEEPESHEKQIKMEFMHQRNSLFNPQD